MNNKLFVAGLDSATTDQQLNELFAAIGQVLSAKVITDRMSGMGKGYGFVEMGTDALAKAAIGKLNGTQYNNRPLAVKEAKPQVARY